MEKTIFALYSLVLDESSGSRGGRYHFLCDSEEITLTSLEPQFP